MLKPYSFHIAICLAIVAAAAQAQEEDYMEVVGYRRLVAEIGKVPDGRTVVAGHIEWSSEGAFAPDVGDSEFAGKDIRLIGFGGVTSHANSVGKLFYGKNSSMAPGVRVIEAWPAQAFLQDPELGLRAGSTREPARMRFKVINNSWVDNPTEPGLAIDALRRFDFMLDRDEVVGIVCTRAGDDPILDVLLSSSYNGIVVGTSNGRNPVRQTTMDGEGRNKPEIVVPMKEPSAAGPVVAAAAAVLVDAAHSAVALEEAAHPTVVKALLLAGASKSPFPTWKQERDEPIDRRFGAGQLDIHASYKMLAAGPCKPAKGEVVSSTGWDRNFPEKGSQLYFFDVPEGGGEFSAVLAWNRTVVDGIPGPSEWGRPQSLLVAMSLRLYRVEGFSVGPLVEASESEVDNLQHVHVRRLEPGRYALEVAADLRTVPYGLAWRLGDGR